MAFFLTGYSQLIYDKLLDLVGNQGSEIKTIVRNNFKLIRLGKVSSLIIPRVGESVDQFKPLELLMKAKIHPTPLENKLELSCKVEFMQTL